MYGHLRPCIHARPHRRFPKRQVEIQPGNTGGRRIYSSRKRPLIEEKPSTRDAYRIAQQISMSGIEQRLKQSKRLSRDKFTANLVSRKSPSFEQQDPPPIAACKDRRRGASGTTTDDDQVVFACR